MKTLSVVFLVFAGILDAAAQSARQDFERINQAYGKANIVSFHTLYQVYETYDAKTPMQTSAGTVKIRGNNMYHKIGSLEVVTHPDYVFSVDHDMKLMVIMKRFKTTDITKQAKPDLDALLKQCSSVIYSEPRKGLGAYDLVYPDSEFSKVKIVFDRKTYLLESIAMYYAEEQEYGESLSQHSKVKLQISYSDYRSDEDLSDDYFSYNKYLKKTGNYQYVVKSPYSSYQFLNNIKDR